MAYQRTMQRRGAGRTSRGRFASTRRTGRARRAGTTRRRPATRSRSRTARSPRASRSRGARTGRRRNLPPRDASGRFTRGRRRAAPRRRARPQRTRRVEPPALGTSIVREASERSRAAPALVRRRWYRIDGPVDPSLPEGYAYPR